MLRLPHQPDSLEALARLGERLPCTQVAGGEPHRLAADPAMTAPESIFNADPHPLYRRPQVSSAM
jgi:hypothetical protein